MVILVQVYDRTWGGSCYNSTSTINYLRTPHRGKPTRNHHPHPADAHRLRSPRQVQRLLNPARLRPPRYARVIYAHDADRTSILMIKTCCVRLAPGTLLQLDWLPCPALSPPIRRPWEILVYSKRRIAPRTIREKMCGNETSNTNIYYYDDYYYH